MGVLDPTTAAAPGWRNHDERTVYAFRTWRCAHRKFQIGSVRGLLESIRLIEGAEIIAGSAITVPSSALDVNGFYVTEIVGDPPDTSSAPLPLSSGLLF